MTPTPPNTPQHSPPLAAVWTPRGRGAVATIRIVGDPELWQRVSPLLFRAASVKQLTEQSLGKVLFGRWGIDAPEEVVVCRCDERVVEIHCHGGEAASRRILEDLQAVGYWAVSWGDMLGATEGRLQAECSEMLARATTARAAAILLEQQSGILARALERLLELLDGSIEAGSSHGSSNNQLTQVVAGIDALLHWAEFGLHLTQPWKVVLAGRPNVGKSSLINALLGYARSIVYSEPGTTRDVVMEETALDGWPVQLADTAGIRENADTLESAGIDRARLMLERADCRVILLDTSRTPHADDLRLLADWPDALVVAHKCDLQDVWGSQVPAEAIRVSSMIGVGIEALIQGIVARLVPEVPPRGTPVPVSPRQVDLLLQAERYLKSGDSTKGGDVLRECLGEPKTGGFRQKTTDSPVLDVSPAFP